MQGTLSEIKVLDQTPHSLFWDVDALGYICLGISTFFLAFVFTGENSQRWLKRFLIANAVMTPFISVVYFYPQFSIALLMLASPWMITASASMFFLLRFFIRWRN